MKRFIALMLSLLVIVSLVPVPALAGDISDMPEAVKSNVTCGSYSGAKWSQDPLCTTNCSANGNIEVSKTAELSAVPGQFDISLQVDCRTETFAQDTATVLVLNLSNSMNIKVAGSSESRLDQLKDVLTEDGGFLDSLQSEVRSSYLSVVVFQNYATLVADWMDISDPSNLSSVKTAIHAMEADDATNIDAGLHYAYELLDSPKVASVLDKYKNVILLSDGAPTMHNHQLESLDKPFTLKEPYLWNEHYGFCTKQKLALLGISETPDGEVFTEFGPGFIMAPGMDFAKDFLR